MESLDYQHLDGLSLESERASMRVDYSEPDQGGTRLMIQFRIPLSGQPSQISGYAHDSELTEREILFTEIPHRVLADARHWIQDQLEKADSRTQTTAILRKFLEVVERETAQQGGEPYA